ncbi:hypothetical protein [Tardiphaga alba]|nr:hypothetical protein [Tardiphaga alba]
MSAPVGPNGTDRIKGSFGGFSAMSIPPDGIGATASGRMSDVLSPMEN